MSNLYQSEVNNEPDTAKKSTSGGPNSASMLSQAGLQNLDSSIVPPFSVAEIDYSKKQRYNRKKNTTNS